MTTKPYAVTRRTALGLAAAGATLPLLHVRSAHAAGSLKLAFWDHWVPKANPVMQKLVAEWGQKNKVDVSLDLLSSGTENSKLPITQAAEALSGSGHDVIALLSWDVQHYHQHLTPIDDVMEEQIKKYGAIGSDVGLSGEVQRTLDVDADQRWLAVQAVGCPHQLVQEDGLRCPAMVPEPPGQCTDR